MTKHKYSRWTLLAAASLCLTLGITSCKDNDDAYTKPEYSITAPKAQNKTFAIPEAGGTASLQLTSNRSWKAVTTADWINISPSAGGAGSVEIKIQVLPNTGANRSAQVALQLGGNPSSIPSRRRAAARAVRPSSPMPRAWPPSSRSTTRAAKSP